MTDTNVKFVKSRDRSSFLSFVRRAFKKETQKEAWQFLESIVFRNEIKEEAIVDPGTSAGRHITWEDTLDYDPSTDQSPILDNNVPLQGYDNAGTTAHDIVKVDTSDTVLLGDTAVDLVFATVNTNITDAELEELSDGSTTSLHTHDHGNLDGLSDDDHTQYLLADGTRALTGDWAAGAFDITLDNTYEFQGKDSGGTARNIANVDGSNVLQIGDSNLSAVVLNAGSGYVQTYQYFALMTNNTYYWCTNSTGGQVACMGMNSDDEVRFGASTRKHDLWGTSVNLRNNNISLNGINAALDTYYNIGKVNGSDQVELGDSGAATYIEGSDLFLSPSGKVRLDNVNLEIDASRIIKGQHTDTNYYNCFYPSGATIVFGQNTWTSLLFYAGTSYIFTGNTKPIQMETSTPSAYLDISKIDATDNIIFGDSGATTTQVHGNGENIQIDGNGVTLTSGGQLIGLSGVALDGNGSDVNVVASNDLFVDNGDVYLKTNNKTIYGRNAADSAYLDILRIDTSNDLRINEDAAGACLLYGTSARSMQDFYLYNTYSIAFRNSANSAWWDTLTVDASDRLVIGAASTFAATRIYGSDANFLTIGASVSNPYTIYMTTNATYLYGQETGGSNRVLIGMTGANQVRIGQNTNRIIMYSNGNVYLYGAGLRLDNAYYLYGLNQAGSAANPLIGVDATDTTVVGNVGFDTVIKSSADLTLDIGSSSDVIQFRGEIEDTGGPTTTHFPNDHDFGFYTNTTSGLHYWCVNHGGTIYKTALT